MGTEKIWFENNAKLGYIIRDSLVLNPSVISPYGVQFFCGHSSLYGHQEWYMARFVVENEH